MTVEKRVFRYIMFAIFGLFFIVFLMGFCTSQTFAREWPKMVNIQTVACTVEESAVSILHVHKTKGIEAAQSHFKSLQLIDHCKPFEGIVLIEDERTEFRQLKIGNVVLDGYVLQAIIMGGQTVYILALIPTEERDA